MDVVLTSTIHALRINPFCTSVSCRGYRECTDRCYRFQYALRGSQRCHSILQGSGGPKWLDLTGYQIPSDTMGFGNNSAGKLGRYGLELVTTTRDSSDAGSAPRGTSGWPATSMVRYHSVLRSRYGLRPILTTMIDSRSTSYRLI